MEFPQPKKGLTHMTAKELREYAAALDRWDRVEGPWELKRRRTVLLRAQLAINLERRRRGEQLALIPTLRHPSGWGDRDDAA